MLRIEELGLALYCYERDLEEAYMRPLLKNGNADMNNGMKVYYVDSEEEVKEGIRKYLNRK